jgi:hypothetical protein
MQILIPPWQSPATATANLSLSRAEAIGLRDALNRMLATGSAGWHAYISWGDNQTDLTLTLETDLTEGGTPPSDRTTSEPGVSRRRPPGPDQNLQPLHGLVAHSPS